MTRSAYRSRWLAYLSSPQWYARRDRYRYRHPNAACLACGAKRYDLHHVDHARSFTKAGAFRGAERDSDLVPLCRPHHDLAHQYWASKRYRTRRLATLAAVADARRGQRKVARKRRIHQAVLVLAGRG